MDTSSIFGEVHFLLTVSVSCSQCAFERGGVESHELCGRYLFVEGWSTFFFARSCSSSDLLPI